MGTTVPGKADGLARLPAAVLAACAAAGGVTPAFAERWQVDAGVGSELRWTSNSTFGQSGDGERDTVITLHPRIHIRGEGARLSVSGSAGLNGIRYVDRTQDSGVQPEADLNARLVAIERLFFVEAGYRASQTSVNPFGARPDAGTTNNTLTTTQARFSPSIEANAGPDLRYRLRSDNTWNREIGASQASTTAKGYFGRHAASIERDPQPLGWRLEAERSDTRYDDDTQPGVTLDLARAIVSYALGEDFSAGVIAGYESNNYSTTMRSRGFGGLQAKWQPSLRTLLSASAERRSFGNGWKLDFSHRTPQLAWNIATSRGISTAPQSLFELPATANVSALLDAMFTTRFPDPAERSRVVQDFINRQNLPTSTLAPISLVSERLSLVTQKVASVALIGVRSTLALSAFHTITEDLPDSGVLATGTTFGNNVQYGGSVAFTHRLSASTGLNVSMDWSRIRALGAIGSDESRQRGASVQVNLQASPKTNAYIGARYRKLDSNVAQEGQEGTAFVGVDHRF